MDNRIQNPEENKNKTYLVIGGIIVLALALAYAFSDRSDDLNNITPASGTVEQSVPPQAP